MHQVFRVFAQQVGLQNVRGILPESIDIFLNQAIEQFVQEVIAKESADRGGRVRTSRGYINTKSEDTSISSINALRTLYKNLKVKAIVGTISDDSVNENVPYKQHLNVNDAMYYTAFSIRYGDKGKQYDCRIIEADELENTLNDYCNGASFDYPICAIYADANGDTYADIYAGSKTNKIYDITIKYFERPRRVSLGYSDKPTINCNLPEYTHNTIVRIAAKLFLESVRATSNHQ